MTNDLKAPLDGAGFSLVFNAQARRDAPWSGAQDAILSSAALDTARAT